MEDLIAMLVSAVERLELKVDQVEAMVRKMNGENGDDEAQE